MTNTRNYSVLFNLCYLLVHSSLIAVRTQEKISSLLVVENLSSILLFNSLLLIELLFKMLRIARSSR